jgi:hypothetical protein
MTRANLCFLAITALFLACSAAAQNSTPEERFEQVFRFVSNGFNSEAIQELERLSTEYPGTQIDARSRFERAMIMGRLYADLESSETLLLEVVSGFPDTLFSLRAQDNLNDLGYHREDKDYDAYLQGLDEIILAAGGTSLNALSTNTEFGTVEYLTELEQHNFLEMLYFKAAVVCDNYTYRPDDNYTYRIRVVLPHGRMSPDGPRHPIVFSH